MLSALSELHDEMGNNNATLALTGGLLLTNLEAWAVLCHTGISTLRQSGLGSDIQSRRRKCERRTIS